MSDKDEHEVIVNKLDDILKILNGNGKMGLCAKVAVLWGSSIFVVSAIVIIGIRVFLS